MTMNRNQPKPVIKLAGVSKSYGDKQVLKPIDLEIHGGQVVGYIGPNGAGKTTTIKILIGITEEFEGKAEICGFDVREHPLEVKKRIGYVPEVANLYDALSPIDYLLFVGRLYHLGDEKIVQRATEMLSILGLKDELYTPMSNFSKGMKQRVLITAGMIHNPDVLFLDEPMSGLDATTVVLIKEIIAQYVKSGKTVFYCSHMMDVVEKVCDRIVILSQGRIVANGSFAELQEIRKENTLEVIFSQLTSEENSNELAEKFTQIVNSDVSR